MKNIIASIRDAIDKEAYLPALALALTIPDVCGLIAYGNEETSTEKMYKRWYRENMEVLFPDTEGFSKKGNVKNAFINAKACYTLRNSIFHSGKVNVPVKNRGLASGVFENPEYIFELRINSSNSFGFITSYAGKTPVAETVRVAVCIEDFCKKLCDSAEKFGEQFEGVFEEHDVQYVDVKAWKNQQEGHRKRLLDSLENGESNE